MTEERYLLLCEKYLKGNCTPQEEVELKKYQGEIGFNDLQWKDQSMGDRSVIRSLLVQKIKQDIPYRKVSFLHSYRWSRGIAASLLILAAAGMYFLMPDEPVPALNASHIAEHSVSDIKPGANKAVLTLANGKQILLNNIRDGFLSQQNGGSISKNGNSLVVQSGTQSKEMADVNSLNTVTIPRGGKFDIVLPDGTKVWLNSSSSITFPTAFSAHERKISLSGEAYFEVAKNKNKPFRINVADKQEIEVVGTHFNVNAYDDERFVHTTLLEGAVKVIYKDKIVILKPGQMAVNNLNSQLTVKAADIEEIMAWKNDLFIFNNENIISLMKKVSRWYDVTISYEGKMNAANVTGNYSCKKSLNNLLKNIELMEKVHFKIEGRRITVVADR